MTRLLLTEVFPPRSGGSGRWFHELYRRLPRDRYVIVAGHSPDDDAFDATHDLRLIRLPLTLPDWGFFQPAGFVRYLRLARRVAGLARAYGVREIHCGRCVPEGWIGYLLHYWLGLPYLCYAHGEEVNLDSAAGGGVMSSKQLRWMARRVLGKASAVIANSRNTTAILQTQWGIHGPRLHTMTPGADTARFVPAALSPTARQALGWSGRRVVLTVGRLQKRKGHDIMIQAMPQILKEIPDILYAIAGAGEEDGALRKAVADSALGGYVQFLGEVDENTLLRCYQQCDLFALPNRQVGSDLEGFGMVLVEAQACGRPVLAGDSGGTAETLVPGQTGEVVDCTRPEPLASAVSRLLTGDGLGQMGAEARRWAVDTYDWTALAVQAERIFSSMTRGER